MSQITYRGNLNAKSFPLIAENFGRSIIVPQYDQTYNKNIIGNTDDDSVGIPQTYYCHNVMPHSQGLQSIGFTLIIGGGIPNCRKLFALADSGDNRAQLGVSANNDFYVSSGSSWIFKGTYSGGLVTTAFISGVTYVYIQGYGCLQYNFGTQTFTPVTLTGLNITGTDAVVGICDASGYMIAWTATAVAWSSTIDPTDFTPSLTTGAGGGNVESAKGSITLCIPLLLGFIIYTKTNAVAAIYSGNARYPFNFREIIGGGGLTNADYVAFGNDTNTQYVYTTSGLQSVSTSQMNTVFPEVTDFISGKLFEDFDESTNTFITENLYTTMSKKINLISGRYLVISYGVTTLTHALVYDSATRRWGKIKIPHVDTFEYQLSSTAITEIPRQSIGFVQADGSVYTVDFNVNNVNAKGVLVLGKYQFVRPRLLSLDVIALENIRVNADNFSLTLLSALDGKNTAQSSPYLMTNQGLFREYVSDAVGINHSLLFKGAFELISVVLTFHIHGKR